MREISPKELNSDFEATLKACSSANLSESDDILEHLIFEEFDVGVTSFLHDSSLKRLLRAGYIDDTIKELCTEFRRKAILALQDCRSVSAVRSSDCWAIVIELSDRIMQLKAVHDQIRKRVSP